MTQTEPSASDSPQPRALDTLGAEDLLQGLERDPAHDTDAEDNLEDKLLRRDLKARMFDDEGSVRIGRYDIRARIGRGGMGTVYDAHDPELDRRVALKLLRPDRRGGAERMLREARALARLTHPNVVTVHEVGTHDGRVYLAMELVEGQTLRDWLATKPSRRQICGVFVQAAKGLRAAHDAGLVHRDFKPDNVLIGRDGRVRVVDFGVVKPAGVDDVPSPSDADGAATNAAEHGITKTGQLLGTPAYMAPEQFLAEPIDARTDVFSFCVTLYEALCSARPFGGDDADTVRAAVLNATAQPLSAEGLSRPLAALVTQGLAREPAARPDSLDGFVERLEAEAAPPQSGRSRARRYGAILFSGAALAGAAVLAMDEPKSIEVAQPVRVEPREAISEDVEALASRVVALQSMLSEKDDTRRRELAESFLETYEGDADDAERAIALSAIGDVHWRASCATPQDGGLCVEEQPLPPAEEHCRPVTRGKYLRHDRDSHEVTAARMNLEAAVALSGIERPPGDTGRQFDEAIGRAMVQLADAELEDFLVLEVPEGLDFVKARDLSESAFAGYFMHATKLGQTLSGAYAKVKETDPYMAVIAGARTGLLSEAFAETVMRSSLPEFEDADDRAAYCGALEDFTVSPRRVAADAYRWTADHAEKHGLSDRHVAVESRRRVDALDASLPPEQAP